MSRLVQDPPPSEPGRTPTDRELVAQARAGDELAFEKLFGRYNHQICVYLVRMVGSDGVGCELAQETFLKAWQALPGLRNEACFVSWLYRIATNVAHDHQRQTRCIRWLSWEEERIGEVIPGPEEQVEETELLKLALAKVSLTYRACLILYIVEELPQREIAERVGIKESCVSTYVRRGLDELRQIYIQLACGPSISKGGKRKR
jgi:RNA polymerase sigma-70 factor (ECF subfamily)